ncbi:MAG: hypothetical protein ACKPKO_65190, partial [Candidatus Fonsibacter sp.]
LHNMAQLVYLFTAYVNIRVRGFSLNFNILSLADTNVPPTDKPLEFKVIFAVDTELIQKWKSLVPFV